MFFCKLSMRLNHQFKILFCSILLLIFSIGHFSIHNNSQFNAIANTSYSIQYLHCDDGLIQINKDYNTSDKKLNSFVIQSNSFRFFGKQINTFNPFIYHINYLSFTNQFYKIVQFWVSPQTTHIYQYLFSILYPKHSYW